MVAGFSLYFIGCILAISRSSFANIKNKKKCKIQNKPEVFFANWFEAGPLCIHGQYCPSQLENLREGATSRILN